MSEESPLEKGWRHLGLDGETGQIHDAAAKETVEFVAVVVWRVRTIHAVL